VRTVEDLRAQPVDTLVMATGEAAGTNLYRIARGWDDRPVTTVRERKSAGAEHTFDDDLHGRRAIAAALDGVTDSALRRLDRHGVAARTVVVKVRVASFTTITRSVTLSRPTSDVDALREAARRALDLAEVVEPVRLLGVSFHGLSAHSQLMLPLGGDGTEAALAAGTTDGAVILGDLPMATTEDDGSLAAVTEDGPATVVPTRVTAAALAPGLDVETDRGGRGWVVHLGDDGRVAVRFETAETGPGYQRWVDPRTEDLRLVAALGPDGREASAAAEPTHPVADEAAGEPDEG
jgi:DNA polymerase-4